MHSKDRYWPVVAGIWFGLTLLFLAALLGIISSFDFSLPELIHGVDWLSLNTYAQITLFLALLTAIYRFGFHYAVLARRRERCRRLALAGDDNAMPIASSALDLSQESTADAMRHEPLVLRLAALRRKAGRDPDAAALHRLCVEPARLGSPYVGHARRLASGGCQPRRLDSDRR